MDTNSKPLILIVDDNEAYRKINKNTMQIEGFEVLEAAHGQEALVILKDKKPHIMLVDIYMPVMDGMAFLQTVKKDPQLSTIPVVMITNVQEELEKAVFSGAEEALLKSSLTPKQIIEVVRKYLAS